MNKSDSERIEGLLLNMGMRPVADYKSADIIILNTCSVRQTAEDRVYGLIRNFSRLKRQKPHLLVAVTGCVAGRDKDGKIKAKMPGVDFFFPIFDLPHLPELIFSRWHRTSGNLVPASREIDYLEVDPKAKEWWRGWVIIQTGCSNYCTYCVVPYARGHEKNRPVKDIMTEAKKLVAGGAKEIHLLGQAVNSYIAPIVGSRVSYSKKKNVGHPASHIDFAALLKEINQISGVNRIGFSSAHPMYMTDKVIKALKLPKMMNFLHLPVQSGNNEVLRRMNRKYTREDYLMVIKKIRKARPDISLATDIIVGFPGETKKQFADTVSLYKKCDFDLSYTAMYSPRTGTAAYKAFADDVPREEKRRRWLVLQKLMEKTALRKNKKYLGKTVEVLVEGCEADKCFGFSREYKKISFVGGKNLIGQVVNVKIKKAREWELEGEVMN
jgi:tRNA-2-methylthio-N6-dimethylallyladenosine synthase